MSRKIPADAFTFYYSLGSERTYLAVAEEFQVSKQAISKHAVKEEWQERVQRLERRARERAEGQLTETVEEMNVRHMRMLKLVQGRALEALKSMPLGTAMEAVRSLEIAMKQERLVRGEPTEHTMLSMEDLVRREHERWMDPEEAKTGAELEE